MPDIVDSHTDRDHSDDTRTSPLSPLLFLLRVAAVYGAATMIVETLPTIDDADLVATGLTLDLIILVPLFYYLIYLIARRPVVIEGPLRLNCTRFPVRYRVL